ncbi:MAG: hypothetical protein ACOX08_12065 [Methanobacterium sp.]|jgi:hypothetical protein
MKNSKAFDHNTSSKTEPKKRGTIQTKKPSNISDRNIYINRNNIESIFSAIKRKFNGTNYSRSTQLSNKETKLKNTIYNIYRSTQIN